MENRAASCLSCVSYRHAEYSKLVFRTFSNNRSCISYVRYRYLINDTSLTTIHQVEAELPYPGGLESPNPRISNKVESELVAVPRLLCLSSKSKLSRIQRKVVLPLISCAIVFVSLTTNTLTHNIRGYICDNSVTIYTIPSILFRRKIFLLQISSIVRTFS